MQLILPRTESHQTTLSASSLDFEQRHPRNQRPVVSGSRPSSNALPTVGQRSERAHGDKGCSRCACPRQLSVTLRKDRIQCVGDVFFRSAAA